MPDTAFRITPDGAFGYAEAGSRTAEPIVFLHGIGGAAKAFSRQLEHFGRDRRAIAWDMPGYGDSKLIPQVTIPHLAEALASFVEQVEIEQPVLVGHSIGGMIVQQFLVAHPGKASAVVLAQTSPAFGRPEGEWQRDFIAARLGPLDRGETMRDLAPRLVAELVGDDPDPTGVALARKCMAAVPEASYRAMILALMGFDLRSALSQIGVPTLLLAGSKDTNAPAPMMARMAEKIPSAIYVCLEGAGHLAPMEQPAMFNETLQRFLDERVRSGERMLS